MSEHKYLLFIELQPKAKTKHFDVRNKLSGCKLGTVKWYAPWRRYCFFIELPGLVFDAGCLADIQEFINRLMEEREANNEVK
jgi:hypothetical protein